MRIARWSDPSTAAPPKPPSPEEGRPSPNAPPADAPPAPRRRRRGLVYALVFLCLGASLGSAVRLALAPPAPPAPGSEADRELVAYFRQRGVAVKFATS